MENFIYHTPTKVYFGKGTHLQVGEILKGYGFRRILMLYGKGSIKKSGLYDEVTAALRASGIEFAELGGVQPNPTVEFVEKAVALARESKAELILAVGGGSVIDAAKYTASGALYEGHFWDFPSRKAEVEKALPVGCILTLAAAGSEMSASAVITHSALHMKRGFNSDFNRCLFAICNPELTYSVSPYQTACGVADILAHTLERYFTLWPDTDLTDRLSESVMKAVVDAGKVLKEDPCNYEARANMMWASSLSHNGLTGCGRENFLPVHQLEHALSGEYEEIAHGAGLAVLIPAWARYVYRENPARFAQFARRVWEVTEPDDEKAALEGIERMADYFVSIGMPARLREFGIPAEAMEQLADSTTFGKTRSIKTYLELDYERVLEIFESCY